jgi:hypothetical protein
MAEGCEHWLVQRMLDERYWACVDCDLEFRPVEPAAECATDVGKLFPSRILDTLASGRPAGGESG